MSSPLDYQNQLIDKYEEYNAKSFEKIKELQKQGHYMVYNTSLTGLYTTHHSYFYSNGDIVDIIMCSRLIWANPTDFIRV